MEDKEKRETVGQAEEGNGEQGEEDGRTRRGRWKEKGRGRWKNKEREME